MAGPKNENPEKTEEAPGSQMDIPFSEVLAGYETQLGGLMGQLVQKDIIIQKLQQALTEKRGD